MVGAVVLQTKVTRRRLAARFSTCDIAERFAHRNNVELTNAAIAKNAETVMDIQTLRSLQRALEKLPGIQARVVRGIWFTR